VCKHERHVPVTRPCSVLQIPPSAPAIVIVEGKQSLWQFDSLSLSLSLCETRRLSTFSPSDATVARTGHSGPQGGSSLTAAPVIGAEADWEAKRSAYIMLLYRCCPRRVCCVRRFHSGLTEVSESRVVNVDRSARVMGAPYAGCHRECP
jgi:hypothetical protein